MQDIVDGFLIPVRCSAAQQIMVCSLLWYEKLLSKDNSSLQQRAATWSAFQQGYLVHTSNLILTPRTVLPAGLMANDKSSHKHLDTLQ